ncbi:Bcr/CflA family drug resistance efflux transporter [Longispora fulva]|uniref:DHA1 family bicyclomycin/chloramphenicol resistance-like MFS transporter n=1 Tax=Longispora fulva TaxID=619741 RepID=A0A8J7GVK3_9ACTN|nr:multidrug effflux MFS transporter [Longispora fulva]MBG6139394.1 DHA1 family bicyclomycin/chloramphenicol resistance-like MFS transporter [Longispora fulva]GIG58892.1 Bcr/CflA family drug resistance efflux transporter [Longispora fulva]
MPRRYFVLLGWLSAFAPLSMDMYLPALPALGREFGAPAADVQLTLTACLIGLAVGQLVAGPLSDRLGRKIPLLTGLAVYALASLACAVANNVEVLIGMRLLQGLAGAAGIVIARAIVRDLYEGVTAVRVLTILMMINGLAPILAPLVGGELLRFGTWRLAFHVLSLIGVGLLAATWRFPESLPAERRRASAFANFGLVLRDRVFLGYTLACALAFAALFGYISASPFVLQNVYGLSAQQFSYAFAANALTLVVFGQVNGMLVKRVRAVVLLRAGLGVTLLGGLLLLTAVLGGLGLGAVLPALALVVGSMGVIFPNLTVLAMADHGATAGTASAVLGTVQYIVGAAAVPLVGLAGDHTALPMAIVVASLAAAAVAAYTLTLRPRVSPA